MRFFLIAQNDMRAVSVSVASLLTVCPPDRIHLILRQNTAARFGPAQIDGRLPASLDVRWTPVDYSLHRMARSVALEEASGPVVLMREGLVLRKDFEQKAGALSGSRILALGRYRSINELSPSDLDRDDPWHLMPDNFTDTAATTIFKARLLRPCLLLTSVEDLSRADFEAFSSLTDWYAYSLFLRGLPGGSAYGDEMSDLVGYIGSQPDRRQPHRQGMDIADALYGLTFGYSDFRSDVRRDLWTLLAAQVQNTFRPAHARGALQFLGGMLASRRQHRKLMANLSRDAVN